MTYNKDVKDAASDIKKMILKDVPRPIIEWKIYEAYGFGELFVNRTIEKLQKATKAEIGEGE